MFSDKIYTDADFTNSVIPEGTRLIFLGYENGVSGTVTLRYKDSSGEFGNIVSSSSGESVTAAKTTITDEGGYFTADTVEEALQEIGGTLGTVETALAEI